MELPADPKAIAGRNATADEVAELLAQSLVSRDPAAVRRADRWLTELGPDAVEPLCLLLTRPNEALLRTACERLGQLGDPRAIAPLKAALRKLECRSERERRKGLPVLVGVIVLVYMLFYTAASLLLEWLYSESIPRVVANAASQAFGMCAVHLCILRMIRRRAVPIIEALGRIAALHPSPETALLAAELASIAGERVLQPRSTRRAARNAAELIRTATGKIDVLPVPVAAPLGDPHALPVPGSPAEEPVCRILAAEENVVTRRVDG